MCSRVFSFIAGFQSSWAIWSNMPLFCGCLKCGCLAECLSYARIHTGIHSRATVSLNVWLHCQRLQISVEISVLLKLLAHNEEFAAVLMPTGNITILISLFILLFCLYSYIVWWHSLLENWWPNQKCIKSLWNSQMLFKFTCSKITANIFWFLFSKSSSYSVLQLQFNDIVIASGQISALRKSLL